MPSRVCGDVNTEASIVSEGVVVGANSKILKSIVGPCVVLGEKVDLEGCIFIGHPRLRTCTGTTCRTPATVPSSKLRRPLDARRRGCV